MGRDLDTSMTLKSYGAQLAAKDARISALEAQLEASAKIMGCAPDKVAECVQMFCDDSIIAVKQVAEAEAALAAAVALNKKLIHAQELDLAEKAELREALAAARVGVEFEKSVTANWVDRTTEAVEAAARAAEAAVQLQGDVERLGNDLAAAREENERLRDKIGVVTNRNLYRLRASQVGNLDDEFLSRCIGAEESAEKLTSGNAGHVRGKLLGELGWLREHVPTELLKKIDALELAALRRYDDAGRVERAIAMMCETPCSHNCCSYKARAVLEAADGEVKP